MVWDLLVLIVQNFLKSIFDNDYPVLIDKSVKDIKQHFLKIIEKKKREPQRMFWIFLKKVTINFTF